MYTHADESKYFCCCCNYATLGHIVIYIFVVLFVIIAPLNVLTPQINKTHLSIVSLNVLEVKLN